MKFSVGEYVKVKESPNHHLEGVCRIISAELDAIGTSCESVVYLVVGKSPYYKKEVKQRLIEEDMMKTYELDH